MNQYTHLSIFEREMIFSLTAQKSSITMIAELIGRNKSTVSRELSRNIKRKRPYSPTESESFIKRLPEKFSSKKLSPSLGPVAVIV